MYQVNYAGLRRRPTYEELVNFLADPPGGVKYRGMSARELMGDIYLQNLFHEGAREMEEQQLEEMKQRQMEQQVRLAARSSDGDVMSLRTAMSDQSSVRAVNANMDTVDAEDAIGAVEQAAADQRLERVRRNMQMFQDGLSALQPAANTALGIAHAGAQSVGTAALDLAGHAGRNIVLNIRDTPGVVSDIVGGVGAVTRVVGQMLDASRPINAPRMQVRGDHDWRQDAAPLDFSGAPPLDQSMLIVGGQGSSSSSAAPKAKAKGRPKGNAQALPAARDPRQGGVEMDYSTNRTYWRGRAAGYIREQVALRRLPTKRENGKNMRKDELLQVLFESL